MSFNWSRRVLLAAAVASLAACGGGGDVESQLQPARIVAFGDGFADVGQNGSRYTVNNGSINIWTQQVAARYGLALTPSSAGGKSYATGNARVNTRPDAAGNNATPTVKEQVDSFLASDKFGATDMVIINAGVSDVIAETAKFAAGAQTQAALQANLKTAGAALATQVRRLVDNGARYVIVVGSYNMGKSPWGNQVPALAPVLTDANAKFNEEMLVNIVDLGAKVLYVDLALYLNLVTAFPGSYSLKDAGSPVCTSIDPGPGIGTGNGQINSFRCTPATLIPGEDPGVWLFADRVYLTPEANRDFGDYAYDRIKARF